MGPFIFRRGPKRKGGPLCIAKQNKRPARRPSLRSGLAGQARFGAAPAPVSGVELAIKAARGGLPARRTNHDDHPRCPR